METYIQLWIPCGGFTSQLTENTHLGLSYGQSVISDLYVIGPEELENWKTLPLSMIRDALTSLSSHSSGKMLLP